MARMTKWPEEYEDLRAEARAAGAAMVGAFAGTPPAADDATAIAMIRAGLAARVVRSPAGSDAVLAGVPCRVFEPTGSSRGTYLHFHGGGLCAGSAAADDLTNAAICDALGVRVISVDYRLAPEHPYPAAFDDCRGVARWVVDDAPGPVVVGGESSGGHLSAVVLLWAREQGVLDRFVGANLVYGVYDLSGTPSHRGVRPTDVPDILNGSVSDTVRHRFLPGWSREDARNPAVSPLFADLRGMPPALFTIGDADHLLDDTLFMAARWDAFGGDVELAVYPDCLHGFMTLPIALAARATERIHTFLDQRFN